MGVQGGQPPPGRTRAARGLGRNDRSEAMEVYAQTRILFSPLNLSFSLALVNSFLL